MGSFSTDEIEGYLRDLIVSRLNDVLGESLRTLFDLPKEYDELAEALKGRVKTDFEKYGLELADFYIGAITPPEEVQRAIDERGGMGAIGQGNLGPYMQYKAARALGDAAAAAGAGRGGGASGASGGGGSAAGDAAAAGLGLGVGAGLGMMVPGMIQGALGGRSDAGPMASGSSSRAVAQIACGACGKESPATASFCSACGAKLAATPACPRCRGPVPAGARFCPSCGSAV